MKFLKNGFLILVIALSLLIISACGDESDTDSSDKGSGLILKFGHVLAPDHPYQLGAEKFKEIIEENAPEPVTVEIYGSSELGSERDLTEGMQLGTVDMALVPGTINSFEPNLGVLDLPFIFRDREHAYKVLDGEIGQELAADLPSKDLRLLAYWENGFRHVTNSSKPINTPEDLAGLKIRVPENNVYVDTFNEWGANVTSMAFGELYTALQQKTIDAQENPIALIYTNKFHETQDYLSLTGHFYGPAHLIMSEQTWNSLSPEMQEVVTRAAEEARDYQRNLLLEKDEEYIKSLEEAGVQINEIDIEAFQKAAEPVWEKYEKQYGEMIERIQEVQ